MSQNYEELKAAYQAGRMSRRTFLRRAAALGVLTPALALGVAANELVDAEQAQAAMDETPQPTSTPSTSTPSTQTESSVGALPTIRSEPTERPMLPPRVTSVAPIAGSIYGGYLVTIRGSRFFSDYDVFFGSLQATEVTVINPSTLRARVPAGAQAGSVTVSVIDQAAYLEGHLDNGFTFVDVNAVDAAQVLGVAPLAIIEDTETELTINGYNLIRAYEFGFVALRGPERAQISIRQVVSSRDTTTSVESLTLTLQITASPALEPLERLNIQIVASTRAGAAGDAIVETSGFLFTVLPRAVPVPLAYTPQIVSGETGIVAIAGRNLAGCSIAIDGTIIHTQQSEDGLIAAWVTPSTEQKANASPIVQLLAPDGRALTHYALIPITRRVDASVSAFDAVAAPVSSENNGAQRALGDPYTPLNGVLTLDLVPIPNQRFVGPTASDSVVVSITGASLSAFNFNWSNFEITVVDITIVLQILNEVRLVPFFDGGGALIRSPVIARVGKLARLRSTGLLLAIRVDVTIHIEVVLIIGFIVYIWPSGLYNEFFGSYNWAIGSVVIGVRIDIDITVGVAWMAALVRPTGQLRVLAGGTLRIGIDFTLNADGRQLNFGYNTVYEARFFGVTPLVNNAPCGAQFQLADDYGQTVFSDTYGGQQAFYFIRGVGGCCLPWDFNMQLVQIAPGGGATPIQQRFRASYCLTSEDSPQLTNVFLTSTPSPQGLPPTLVMNIADTAILHLLSQSVNAQGQPVGGLQDIRDLGYDVVFYFDNPPDVLDPTSLPGGTAFAVLDGQNLIRASYTSVRILDEEPALAFFPPAVVGFDIARFVAVNQPPRLRVLGLPVVVNPLPSQLNLTALLVERNPQTGQVTPIDPQTKALRRVEPFQAPRNYLLGLQIQVPATEQSQRTLRFTVQQADLVVEDVNGVALSKAPLEDLTHAQNRHLRRDAASFFSGELLRPTATATYVVGPGQSPTQILVLDTLGLYPNHVEATDPQTGQLRALVPPGRAPLDRVVKVRVTIKVAVEGGGATVVPDTFVIEGRVFNDETFEEYLRVLKPVQDVLAQSQFAALQPMPEAFYNELLRVGPTPVMLSKAGADLWERAGTIARTANAPNTLDDRPLYYVRLLSLAALRAYAAQQTPPLSPAALATAVSQFELPSRGLAADGSLSLDMVAAGTRRVVITGFDPFGTLTTSTNASYLTSSNPSGLTALKLNKSEVGSGDRSGRVQSVIFPVRYADFTDGFDGIVERALTSALRSLVMLVTISQNGDDNYYDIERFASSFRGSFLDNNNEETAPFWLLGQSYLETTLPYADVISPNRDDVASRRLNGVPFLIDQSYQVSIVPEAPQQPPYTDAMRSTERREIIVPDLRRPIPKEFRAQPLASSTDPRNDEEEGYKRQPDRPLRNLRANKGSGGSFLSNEIFYRTARLRTSNRPGLASGHLHIPPVGSDPVGQGPAIVDGTRTALSKFVTWSFLLGRSSIMLPPTVIGTSSIGVRTTVTNSSDATVVIASITVSRPFTVAPTTALPITLAPNASCEVIWSYTPRALADFNAEGLFKDTNGAIVHLTQLAGTGIAP